MKPVHVVPASRTSAQKLVLKCFNATSQNFIKHHTNTGHAVPAGPGCIWFLSYIFIKTSIKVSHDDEPISLKNQVVFTLMN